jgi:neutral ceramidase
MSRTFIALFLLILCSAAQAGELRVGAAAVSITPPLGAALAGYYSPRQASAVHDELYASALVMEQDGSKASMVVCDLLTLPRGIVLPSRQLIEQQCGIAADRVMISATHTHTGPALPVGASRDPALEADTPQMQEYVRALPGLIARAVKEADAKLAPARVSAAIGHEEHLSFNRRYFMSDGTVGWNPGKRNPKIVKPAGPIDPDVPVVYFQSPDGQPLATYVNFAMHLDTTGGTLISSDYPYTLRTLLGHIEGPEMISIFSTGTCGDINHIDVNSADPQKGTTEPQRIGTILAGEVLKTYAKLQPVATFAPRAKSRVLELALPKVTDEDLAHARKVATTFGKNTPPFLERVNAYKVLDVAARQGKPLEAEVQVIALGDDLAWVALPGEIFVELGLEIKKQSPFKNTILVELADGSVGYVPTERAYKEGNYEPTSARCAAGSGEQIEQAAIELLKELKK